MKNIYGASFIRPPKHKMSLHLLIFILLLIVHFGNGYAQIDFPVSVNSPISAVFPNSKIVNGDLNNDGINDLAILVPEETDNGITDRVAIYIGKPGGSYVFFAKSLGIQYGTAVLKIQRNSLYVTTFHNSLKENYSEIYQFKYLDKYSGFVLIGKEDKSYSLDDENEYIVSINYLTGKKIEREKSNGKTKETKSQLNKNERKLLKLEEFNV